MNNNTSPRLTLILFAFWAWMIIPALHAQTFSAMLVAGVNLSQIDGDKLGGFNKFGLNTGARVSARLNDRWHLSTEFLFSQQGANAVKTDDISSTYDRIQLNFVEVPFMINYEVINDDGEDITEQEMYREDMPALVLGATYKFSEKLGLNFRWSRYLTSLIPADDNPNTVDVNFIGRTIGIRLYYYL